jgi:acyl-homoserine-lactone acylase
MIRRLFSSAFRKNMVIVLILFLIFSCNYKAPESKTEILWDNYGVPHIYGENAEEMYYSFGWAQMSCHADLILRLYAQARGRASEYFGSSYIESDKKMLSFNLTDLAEKGFKIQDDKYKAFVAAFVKGMNDYASKNKGEIGGEFHQVLPVTVNDVMAHTIRVTCLEFLAGDDISTVKRLTEPGSNAIAIAPSRSASGNALLLTNPHLPWYDFLTWYEAHLNTKGFNAYGVALVGMPSLSMAFNDNLGWAHTVNPIDASDRYELTIKDGGYIIDNKIVPFEKKVVTFNVKNDDGSLMEMTFELRLSEHGPVIGEKENKAYAVRIAGLENARIFEQYHKMALSSNIREFESAVSMLQNPMFNIIYADREGNILYIYNGNVPVRSEGDFSFWRGTINGSISKFIWNDIHPYADLPRLLNPESGFIQNCNDPPWTCTYPTVLDPADYPAYFASGWMSLRPQRAVNMIKDNLAITFDQLVDYKLNTGMEAADRFLDDLLQAVEEYPDSMALKAADVLKAWDRKTETTSRGAILFAAWWDGVKNTLFEKKWDPLYPVSTPDGIKDKKAAVNLLSKVAAEVISKYGSLDIAWGDVHRFRINGLDYPANGGPGDHYGIFRTMYYSEGENNTRNSIAGDTYIAVTEFGKEVRADVLLGYGNSSQPGNKHFGDQLKMMSEKILRPALLKKSEILKNMEKRESFDK